MAEKSPAYLMYPDDILASGRVNSLEPLEELWYRRAIDLGWKNLGMPSDPVEFAGWVGRGCTPEAAEKIIKKMYVPHKKDPSKVINERQELERKKLEKTRKKKSAAGKKGMERRWGRTAQSGEETGEKKSPKKSEKKIDFEEQKSSPALNASKQTALSDNTVITNDNISIPISISNKEEFLGRGVKSSAAHPPDITPPSQTGIPEASRPEKPKPKPANIETDRLDPSDAKSFGFAVEQFVASFPNVRINLVQAGLLASAVIDKPTSRKAWNSTIGKYIGNRDPVKGSYDPARIGTVIEVYRDEMSRLEKANGTNQQGTRQTASERNVERYVAGRDLAQRIASGEADEALESIYGGVGDHYRKDPDPLQLAAAD